jgi:hypothetical protein
MAIVAGRYQYGSQTVRDRTYLLKVIFLFCSVLVLLRSEKLNDNQEPDKQKSRNLNSLLH